MKRLVVEIFWHMSNHRISANENGEASNSFNGEDSTLMVDFGLSFIVLPLQGVATIAPSLVSLLQSWVYLHCPLYHYWWSEFEFVFLAGEEENPRLVRHHLYVPCHN